MKKTRIIYTFAMLCICMAMMGQAKKPKLMVVPSNAWCTQNGFMTTYQNQGVTERIPDYSKALSTDMDLTNVITQLGALMHDRGFDLVDLQQALNNINRTNAENSLIRSKTSGATLAESPIDRLHRIAKADIIINLQWKVITVGPKKSIQYTLQGVDAYSNKQVAAATGVGPQSFSAPTETLLSEAVADKMDAFCSQLQSHFDDMLANGREVAIDINVFNNGSGLDLETEFGGKELIDIIDDWFNNNCVNHRYSRSDATETMAVFDQVRMPLYDLNGKAIDTRAFTKELANYLKNPPYNITSKIITIGLGKCQLILGEK